MASRELGGLDELHNLRAIVAFKRKGWKAPDYQKWSDKLLADQIGFIPPSSDKGEAILRFAIVNPWTKISDISMILDTL